MHHLPGDNDLDNSFSGTPEEQEIMTSQVTPVTGLCTPLSSALILCLFTAKAHEYTQRWLRWGKCVLYLGLATCKLSFCAFTIAPLFGNWDKWPNLACGGLGVWAWGSKVPFSHKWQ
jgi:hypothetical protein